MVASLLYFKYFVELIYSDSITMYVNSLMYSPNRYYALQNMNLRLFWLKHIKSDLVYNSWLNPTAYGMCFKELAENVW